MSLSGSAMSVGRRERRPVAGLQLGIFDPWPGFGDAGVEMADIAYPVAERAAIGVKAPGADDDLAHDVAAKSGTEQQHGHAVLGGVIDRLPRGGGVATQAIDLGRRSPAQLLLEHGKLLQGRAIGPGRQLAMRPALGAQRLGKVGHEPPQASAMRLPVCESNRCRRVAPMVKRRSSPGLAVTWPPSRTVISSRASPNRPCSRVSAPSGSASSTSNSSGPSLCGNRCSGLSPNATGVPAAAEVATA